MSKIQQTGKTHLGHRFLYKKIEWLYQKPTRRSRQSVNRAHQKSTRIRFNVKFKDGTSQVINFTSYFEANNTAHLLIVCCGFFICWYYYSTEPLVIRICNIVEIEELLRSDTSLKITANHNDLLGKGLILLPMMTTQLYFIRTT